MRIHATGRVEDDTRREGLSLSGSTALARHFLKHGIDWAHMEMSGLLGMPPLSERRLPPLSRHATLPRHSTVTPQGVQPTRATRIKAFSVAQDQERKLL